MKAIKKLISIIICAVLLTTSIPFTAELLVNNASASISDTSVEAMMFYEYLKNSKTEIMNTFKFPDNLNYTEVISALIDDFNSDGKKEMLLFSLREVRLYGIYDGKVCQPPDSTSYTIEWNRGLVGWSGNGSSHVCAEYKDKTIYLYCQHISYGGSYSDRIYIAINVSKNNRVEVSSFFTATYKRGAEQWNGAGYKDFTQNEDYFQAELKKAGFNVDEHYHNDYQTANVPAQLFEGFKGNHVFTLFMSNWDYGFGMTSGYLYDNTKLKSNVDFEIRASKPDMQYCIGENFLIGAFHKNSNIIDKTTQYAISVSNSDVVEFIKNQKNDGITSFLFNTKNPGEALITIKELFSGVSRVISVTVLKDRINCVPCEKLNNGGLSTENIYCVNFKCSNIKDKTHSISFDAYNGYYTYGIVEIYEDSGEFLEAHFIDPISASSGVKLFVDSISYLGYDLFYSNNSFYYDPENYKHTPVNLKDIPNGCKIILTNNSLESDRLAFYNGVDIFISSLIEILPISINAEDNKKTVAAFANALLANISDSAYKDLTKSISESIAKGGTEKSAKSIYEAMVNISQQANIDTGKYIKDFLTGLGYSFADTLVSIIVPPFEILNKTIDILEIVNKIDDLYECNNNESYKFFASYHVDKLKKLASNGVIAESEKGFTKEVFNVELYEGDIMIDLKSGEFLNTIPYEIDMYVDGIKTAPDNTVTVSIPIPKGFNKKECGILRQEKDGSYSFLKTTITGDYITFETDHFSLYILFEAKDIDQIKLTQKVTRGDIDSDGKITAADARLALRASVGLEKFSEAKTLAADVDNNKTVTAADARIILRASVGLEKL